jgi:hypothetical protein
MEKKTIHNTLLTVKTDRIFQRAISINLPRVLISKLNQISTARLLSRFIGLGETETNSVQRNAVNRLE